MNGSHVVEVAHAGRDVARETEYLQESQGVLVCVRVCQMGGWG